MWSGWSLNPDTRQFSGALQERNSAHYNPYTGEYESGYMDPYLGWTDKSKQLSWFDLNDPSKKAAQEEVLANIETTPDKIIDYDKYWAHPEYLAAVEEFNKTNGNTAFYDRTTPSWEEYFDLAPKVTDYWTSETTPYINWDEVKNDPTSRYFNQTLDMGTGGITTENIIKYLDDTFKNLYDLVTNPEKGVSWEGWAPTTGADLYDWYGSGGYVPTNQALGPALDFLSNQGYTQEQLKPIYDQYLNLYQYGIGNSQREQEAYRAKLEADAAGEGLGSWFSQNILPYLPMAIGSAMALAGGVMGGVAAGPIVGGAVGGGVGGLVNSDPNGDLLSTLGSGAMGASIGAATGAAAQGVNVADIGGSLGDAAFNAGANDLTAQAISRATDSALTGAATGALRNLDDPLSGALQGATQGAATGAFSSVLKGLSTEREIGDALNKLGVTGFANELAREALTQTLGSSALALATGRNVADTAAFASLRSVLTNAVDKATEFGSDVVKQLKNAVSSGDTDTLMKLNREYGLGFDVSNIEEYSNWVAYELQAEEDPTFMQALMEVYNNPSLIDSFGKSYGINLTEEDLGDVAGFFNYAAYNTDIDMSNVKMFNDGKPVDWTDRGDRAPSETMTAPLTRTPTTPGSSTAAGTLTEELLPTPPKPAPQQPQFNPVPFDQGLSMLQQNQSYQRPELYRGQVIAAQPQDLPFANFAQQQAMQNPLASVQAQQTPLINNALADLFGPNAQPFKF